MITTKTLLSKITNKSIFLSFVTFIFIATWFIQSNRLCNPDVCWLAEASLRMLNGGTYAKDFFENNPPWVLYFYIPATLLVKMFSTNIILAIRLYFFTLIFISLYLSNFILQKIFSKEDSALANLFLLSLAITFLIFPMYEFGQREHLLFILSMPYFLMMTCRLQNEKISPYLAITIGFLAGSVFILKPYFLAPLLFIEIYYILNKKHLLASLRPEIYTIMALLFLYFSLILIRHLDYLYLVIPHVWHWVYLGADGSLWIANVWILWSLLSILFFIATYTINRYKSLSIVMLIGLSGFLFSYFAQYTAYPYRILPVACIVIVIFTLFFCIYLTTPKKETHIYYLTALTIFILLNFCGNYAAFLSYHVITHPVLFFCAVFVFFSITLFLLMSYGITNQLSYIKHLVLPILIGYIFFLATGHFMNWSIWHAAGTCLLLVLLFGSFIPGSFENKTSHILIIFLSMLIFSIPLFDMNVRFGTSKSITFNSQPLIRYIDNHASNQSIYVFSTNLGHTFPIIAYTKNTESASRFSGFWFLPGLIKQRYIPGNNSLNAQQISDKNFFIRLVVEDLELKKPKLLFIDDLDIKYMLSYKNGDEPNIAIPYDFISDFSMNNFFHHILQNYHYKTTVVQNSIIKINPLLCKFELTYNHIPQDSEIKLEKTYNKLYLYLRSDGDLEIAFRNYLNNIERIKFNNGITSEEAIKIKANLSRPGQQLSDKNQQVILSWIAKQDITFPFYKFKVYEKNDIWK